MTSERTQQRNRYRTAEDAELLELGRELDWLARRYGRFAGPINKLTLYVRAQLKPAAAKRTAIIEALRISPLELDELCDETKLDRYSVTTELAALEQSGAVVARDRDGGDVVIRKHGRPSRTPVYRLGRTDPRGVGQNAPGVGPSRTSARRG